MVSVTLDKLEGESEWRLEPQEGANMWLLCMNHLPPCCPESHWTVEAPP